MQVFECPRAPSPWKMDAELVSAARTLATRFPEARLRPCALARLPELDERVGARVWVALESLQVTGSFKVRGALLALSRLKARGADIVVAASAGNHGAGVAYAANVLDVGAIVVVPKGAPEAKRARIESYGADLVVSEREGYDFAELEARALAKEKNIAFLSPYDDDDVIAGNGASLAFEIEAALGHAPAVVIVPIGGGGLATGMACALPSSRVFGAQSAASPAFARSIARGAAVESLDPAPTLADGLEGGIARRAFERASSVLAGVVVVTEAAIGAAMAAAHRSLGVTIEGSAAAAVAPLVSATFPSELKPASSDSDVVVVLTGRNVDHALHSDVLAQNPGALW